MMSLIVDCETLGLDTHAVILQLAWTVAESGEPLAPIVNRVRSVHFSLPSQILAGRTIDQDTLRWWRSQPARDSVFRSTDRVSPAEGLAETFWGDLHVQGFDAARNDDHVIWQRGSCDTSWINDLTKDCGVSQRLPYNKVQDTRTALNLVDPTCRWKGYPASNLTGKEADLLNLIQKSYLKHDAVFDVASDAIFLHRYGLLNGWPISRMNVATTGI